MNNLWNTVTENIGFLLVIVLIAAAIAIAARLSETYICRVQDRPRITIRITIIGMLSAIAFILQFFEFPLLFIAPSFYKLDFSEVPVLICAFSMGPVAGVLAELVKNILKILIRGTSTAFVGDFANFFVGCSLVLPASIVYFRKKTKIRALIGCIVGTLTIALVGSLFNAVYLLPAFAKFYGMELDAIIGMGAKIFPSIDNFTIYHFVFCCVAPINLIKGVMVSIIVMFIYKPIRTILQSINKM